MAGKCNKVSLRCFTDEPKVEFISEALGISPSQVAIKGDLASSRNPKSMRFPQSVWILESAAPSRVSIDDHADALLRRMEARVAQFQSIRSRLASVDFHCYIDVAGEQAGISASSVLLARLAAFGVALELDIYVTTEAEK